MKTLFLTLLSLVTVLMFGGCGAAIGNLEAYNPVPLQRAEHMPSKEEIKSGKSKIVLFKIDDKGFRAAERANVGQSLYVEVARQLTQSGTVEILDRKIADRLENEIRLAELNQEGTMSDDELSVARFAVAGEISNADFTSRFVQRNVWYDKKGRKHVVPAHYIYTASVSGLIKIYAIPSMRIVKTIEFNDNKSRREHSQFLQSAQQFDAGLINGAGRDAINAARIDLKNFFAPKGFILSKRSDGKKNLFQVTLGSQHGLRKGNNVNIYSIKSIPNPLTGEDETEEVVIAKGKVSEKLTANRAWIIVEDENPSNPVHLGDYMKVEYSKGTLDYLNDLGRGYNMLLK